MFFFKVAHLCSHFNLNSLHTISRETLKSAYKYLLEEFSLQARNWWACCRICDCRFLSVPIFLVLLWLRGWEQVSGRQKETNTETYRTKTEEGKQRKREDTQQTAKESGLLISSASLAPSCVGAGCINTSFPFGPDRPSRTLSAPLLRPSLPIPPCPAPSYPPSPFALSN